VMAVSRRRLNLRLLRQAMDSTMKLSSFVVMILVGSTTFSLSFQAVDGAIWVEHLLTSLPGGQLGFLIVVNILIFVLAFFLDFFELAFIIVPLVGPVAAKLGIDLTWFGVVLAVNMQTSFMHPPFGFALFYLRSVAPVDDYDDKVTGKRVRKVTTGDIYRGAIPFVVIQVVMVALVIAFPQLVTGGLQKEKQIDIDKAFQDLRQEAPQRSIDTTPDATPSAAPASGAPAADSGASGNTDTKEDPMKALIESMQRNQAPKKP
jgi:TRAP-type mannitol/chloroaromatic compound transport system permease large subunit